MSNYQKGKRQRTRGDLLQGFIDNPEAFRRTYEQTGGKRPPAKPITEFRCAECETKVDLDAKKCPHCGENFLP